MVYNAFIKLKVRKVIAEKSIPLERAIDFLKENPKHGVILDNDKKEYTLEDLNAESIRPEPRIESDSPNTHGREVSESTYRKLFETIADNSESGTERDN